MDQSLLERATGIRTQRPLAPLHEHLAAFARLGKEGVLDGPRYKIHYTSLGNGPPVFIVPGICTSRIHYARLAVELSKRFRAIVYDLPGIADRDDANLKTYRIDDYPLDLLALADHLGDDRFCVAGVSFGTTICVRAMAAAPQRIERGMLLGGFARRPLTRLERWLLRILRHFPGRMRYLPLLGMVTRYNHQRELDLREPGLFDFMDENSGKTPVATGAAQVLAVDQTDVRELAARVSQVVMIVHGESDRLVPVHLGAELAQLIPKIQIMLIPDCGHDPHLSHPELLAHAAEQFFGDRR